MQVYIQELTARTHLSRFPQPAKDRICMYAAAVAQILGRAVSLQLAGMASCLGHSNSAELLLFEA